MRCPKCEGECEWDDMAWQERGDEAWAAYSTGKWICPKCQIYPKLGLDNPAYGN